MSSKTLNYCQISKQKDLRSIINLGYQPPVNEYKKIGSSLNEEKFFPCELFYSPSSKLYQLNTIVDKEILFPKSYPYTSSTTKILRENFFNLYRECMRLFKIKSTDLAIDIGSNDGNLLSNFKNSCRVLGITPETIGRIAKKKGVETYIDYFDSKIVNKILKKKGKARFVFATNVFAHIDDVKKVIKNIKKILKKDGIFVSESHYFVELVKTCQFDTIYHEHLRYYTLAALDKLFKSEGLHIIYAKKINTHGGSIRVYVSRKKYYISKNNISYLKQKEKKLISNKNINLFKNKVVRSKLLNLKLLSDLKEKNKTIIGISSPSRSTTLINYFGLNEDIIDYVLEIKGSHKIGKYVPGTKIPIFEESMKMLSKADFLFLFSWHISKDLVRSIKSQGYKGKFIIPLPKPMII